MNYTESKQEPNPNYVPPATKPEYAETIKERLNHRHKIDPLLRLFDYACDRFYIIEHNRSDKPIIGLLLNCFTSQYWFLTEHGIFMVKSKDVEYMSPIPMPKNLSDNFRLVIEQYLKERINQNVKED